VAVASVAGGCGADVVEMGDEGVAGEGLFTDVVRTVPTSAGGEDGSGAGADTTAAPSATAPNPSPYDLGSCIVWDQADSAPVFEVVPCDAPHLVEVTDVILFEEDSELRFPTLEDLLFVTDEYCADAATSYLGGTTPAAEVQPGAIPPTVEEWDDGERWFACTLGLAREGGLRPAYTGRLASGAQSA
jgi:hypothetical protein